MSEIQIPHSADTEKLVLGAVLLDARLAVVLAANLTEKDFYLSPHADVFAAIKTLVGNGSAIDPIMIHEELKRRGKPNTLGGAAGITNLTFGLPHFSEITNYIAILKKHALNRELLNVFRHAQNELVNPERDTQNLLERITKKLITLQEYGTMQTVQKMTEVVREVHEMFDDWKSDKRNVMLPTGIPELDSKLALKGLGKGDLILIGARPGKGKTAIAVQIAAYIAQHAAPTLFFTLEMEAKRIVKRMLPMVTGIKNREINPFTVKYNAEAENKLREGLNKLGAYEMFFDAKTENLGRLCSTAEYFVQNKGVGLIVADYMQLIKPDGEHRNREREVGSISTELKRLAKRCNVPVIAAIQLNRKSELDNRRPELTDLRESGQAEQDADLVLFPYETEAQKKQRKKDYPQGAPANLDLMLYCPKQRDGMEGWEQLITFERDYQRFMTQQMSDDEMQSGAYEMFRN